MLSRVAERLYWLGRYVERAENTARLVVVNHNLQLDLPGSAGALWASLLTLLGTSERYAVHHSAISERSVVRWMVADERHDGSLVSSLRAARENARTVREVIPSEAWELINDLYWYASDSAEQASARRTREDCLNAIVLRCQQFAGMLHNTMSHREPFHFLMLGALLERADMTSRIVDVGAETASQWLGGTLAAYENILWMNVLLSLSAYQMYRQQVRERVNGPDVVRFLLLDPAFPHAITWCLNELEAHLGALPRNREPLQVNRRVHQQLMRLPPDDPLGSELHELIDELQVQLGGLHTQIAATWFALRE